MLFINFFPRSEGEGGWACDCYSGDLQKLIFPVTCPVPLRLWTEMLVLPSPGDGALQNQLDIIEKMHDEIEDVLGYRDTWQLAIVHRIYFFLGGNLATGCSLHYRSEKVLKCGCCYGMREGNRLVHLIVDTILASSCPSSVLHPPFFLRSKKRHRFQLLWPWWMSSFGQRRFAPLHADPHYITLFFSC